MKELEANQETVCVATSTEVGATSDKSPQVSQAIAASQTPAKYDMAIRKDDSRRQQFCDTMQPVECEHVLPISPVSLSPVQVDATGEIVESIVEQLLETVTVSEPTQPNTTRAIVRPIVEQMLETATVSKSVIEQLLADVFESATAIGALQTSDSESSDNSESSSSSSSSSFPSTPPPEPEDEEIVQTPPRTKNESKDMQILPVPSITWTPQHKLIQLGIISSLQPHTAIIRTPLPKLTGDIDISSVQALDTGSVVCISDRKLLGVVHETFGPVVAPMYVVRFENESMDGVCEGMDVYWVREYANVVHGGDLNRRGYDTSDVNDEETAIQDFSDDEAEQRARRRKRPTGGGVEPNSKRRRGGGEPRGANRGSFRGRGRGRGRGYSHAASIPPGTSHLHRGQQPMASSQQARFPSVSHGPPAYGGSVAQGGPPAYGGSVSQGAPPAYGGFAPGGVPYYANHHHVGLMPPAYAQQHMPVPHPHASYYPPPPPPPPQQTEQVSGWHPPPGGGMDGGYANGYSAANGYTGYAGGQGAWGPPGPPGGGAGAPGGGGRGYNGYMYSVHGRGRGRGGAGWGGGYNGR